MFVEEVMSRYAHVFEPAKKSEKADHVRLMNDELLVGKILVRLGSPLQEELAALPKDPDWDPLSGRAPLEDPRFPNHCADAALYAWRRAYNFLYTAEKPPVKRGTPEFHDETDERIIQSLVNRGREKPWWEQGLDHDNDLEDPWT